MSAGAADGSANGSAKLVVDAVLFDLDGTVVDSAPDLAGAANAMRAARGLGSVDYALLRPCVGSGARGMVGAAFGIGVDDPEFDTMRIEFLDRYAQRLLELTQVFAGMEPVLRAIEAAGVPWGVVTNKHQRFTTPIVDGLGITRRAGVVICGDTTPHAKPHPAPLFEAARRLGVQPSQCIYVGDDRRDIEAARAAGMHHAAAAWGYIAPREDVGAWGAGVVLQKPADLLNWIELA